MSVATLSIAMMSYSQCVLSAKDSALIAKLEIENTAEDMIEWIIEDVASEYLDSAIADTYIDNLEEIIEDLK